VNYYLRELSQGDLSTKCNSTQAQPNFKHRKLLQKWSVGKKTLFTVSPGKKFFPNGIGQPSHTQQQR